jgi:hypothetical protein
MATRGLGRNLNIVLLRDWCGCLRNNRFTFNNRYLDLLTRLEVVEYDPSALTGQLWENFKRLSR